MASKVLATIISMRDQFTGPARQVARSTRNINREVQRTQNQIRRFGVEMKKTTLNVASNALKMGAAFAGIGAGFAVKEGLSQAMDLEGARLTLETVMKDAKKAKEMLTWGTDFSNKTPFENKEVTEAIVKLQSYGIEAKATLPQIGDMAAVMGKSLDQGVEAIADAQTGQLERLKEFGMTKDMIVKKAQEMRLGLVVNNKGQITDQKKFNSAMFALMNDKFAGGMEKQSKTLKGIWSTITGVTGSALAEIIGITKDGSIRQGSIYESLKVKVQAVGDTLTKWQNDGTIQRIGEQVTSAVSTMIQILQDVFKIISTIYNFFKNNWSTIAPIFLTIVGALTAYKVAMIAMTVYTKAFALAEFVKNAVLATGATTVNIMTSAQWAWNAAMTANPIGLVIAGIAALITVGILLYKNWDKIKLYCLKLWETMKGFFMAVWNNPLGKFLIVITNLFNPLAWLIGLGVLLYKNWNTVKLYCLSLWETIKGFFMMIWNNPFGKFLIVITNLFNPLAWLIGLGVTLYKNWDNIKLVAGYLWEQVKKLWDMFTGFAESLGKMAWDFIAQRFQNLKDNVLSLIEPLKNAVNWVKSLFGGGDKKVEVKTTTVNGKNTVTMQKYALGGIATKASIFGEAGPEIAIPLNHSKRSKELLAQANGIINKNSSGVKSSASIVSSMTNNKTENKTFQIIFQGNVYGFDDFKEKVAKAMYEIYSIDGANVAVIK